MKIDEAIKTTNFRPVVLSVLLAVVHFKYFPLVKSGFDEIGIKIGNHPLGDISGYRILSYFAPMIVLIIPTLFMLTLLNIKGKFNAKKILLILEMLLFAVLFLYLIVMPSPAMKFLPM